MPLGACYDSIPWPSDCFVYFRAFSGRVVAGLRRWRGVVAGKIADQVFCELCLLLVRNFDAS